jgi:hypothetical protein
MRSYVSVTWLVEIVAFISGRVALVARPPGLTIGSHEHWWTSHQGHTPGQEAGREVERMEDRQLDG